MCPHLNALKPDKCVNPLLLEKGYHCIPFNAYTNISELGKMKIELRIYSLLLYEFTGNKKMQNISVAN